MMIGCEHRSGGAGLEVKILFFGRLADLAGDRERELELPGHVANVFALREWVAGDQPLLRAALAAAGIIVLVNDEIRHGPAPVSPGDEVAFLPVLSGG